MPGTSGASCPPSPGHANPFVPLYGPGAGDGGFGGTDTGTDILDTDKATETTELGHDQSSGGESNHLDPIEEYLLHSRYQILGETSSSEDEDEEEGGMPLRDDEDEDDDEEEEGEVYGGGMRIRDKEEDIEEDVTIPIRDREDGGIPRRDREILESERGSVGGGEMTDDEGFERVETGRRNPVFTSDSEGEDIDDKKDDRGHKYIVVETAEETERAQRERVARERVERGHIGREREERGRVEERVKRERAEREGTLPHVEIYV
jgi:hypothetical protein